jgi:membrane-associated protein
LADAFLSWVKELPGWAVYGVLMALSALENVFPPVPADVAVVLGAFLSRRGLTVAPLLGLLCWLANTVTSAGMYFLARARGAAFFASGWPRALLPPQAMAALREASARHGVLGIFVSRFLPGVRAAVTPFAGVVGMSPLRALLPAAAASAIWYALLVAAGSIFAASFETARALVDDVHRALGLASAALLGGFVLWLWTKRRRAS